MSAEPTREERAHWTTTGRCLHCGQDTTTVRRSGVLLNSRQNARRRVKVDTHGHAMSCTAPTGAR